MLRFTIPLWQELDITATDVSKECLLDVLPRIPAIRWLAAGQLDGFTDQVMKVIDTLQLFTLFVKSTGVFWRSDSLVGLT